MQKLNKFKEDFHKRFCSWNCPIWFKNMQSFLQIIVNAKVFEIFIVMCIIVNTIFLAADHHDADDNLKNALSIGNSGKVIFLSLLSSIAHICQWQYVDINRLLFFFVNLFFSFHLHFRRRSLPEDIGTWFHHLLERSVEHIWFRDCDHFNLWCLHLTHLAWKWGKPELGSKCVANFEVQIFIVMRFMSVLTGPI